MIVKLQGGLGNQIFIASFGFSEAQRRGEEVFFDLRSYQTDELRSYELHAYDLPIKILTEARHGNRYYDDYFQDENLFDNELVCKLFRKPKGEPNPECLKMAERILNTKDTCFIGVRRADYLWPERINFHGVLDMDYYLEAFQKFPYRTKYFIFTDDPEWCREHFRDEIVEVNGPNEKAWDIWLMSLCDSAIIANSTFHWWGSWFLEQRNPGAKIIAPVRWFADTKMNERWSIVPERWVKI